MLFPGNSNLATAQAAATPNTRLSGTTIAATSNVRPIADCVSGSSKAARKGSAPRLSASEKTASSGMTRNKARKPTASAISVQRTTLASVSASRMAEPAAAEGLQAIYGEQRQEGDREHHRRDGGGAGIVELLELGDDEQRRDLRDERHVAGDEDHRAVLADGAGKSERHARQHGGRQCGQHDAEHGLTPRGAQRRRRLLDLAVQVLQHR